VAAIKLEKFLGVAPKISTELLPKSAGQVAHNVKLYSGDLLPYRKSKVVDSAERTGTIQTLFGMNDPVTDVVNWLSWLTDVDVAIASDTTDGEQRFYYTGDGVPKTSNFALATTGSEPYPVAYYDLGLPLPDTVPTVTAASFTSATSSTKARDSGNTATIVTAAAHNFRTGNVVTVRGFTPAPADDWNTTNAYITVVDDTTITYYNSGDLFTAAADTSGVIDLSGFTQTRTYVYTWFTPWDEESIASEPSDELYIKEGQPVTVSGLPTAGPGGTDFVEGMRLYRTLSSSAGTEYFRLATLWFPQLSVTVARTSNVSTVKMVEHHNLEVDDRFKLAKCTDTSFNITDGIVTVVDDDYTFSYAQVASNVTEKADTTGVLYHDVAEVIDDPARYYGDDSIGTSLRERTSNVATITTAAVHGLVTNQIVTVSGMTDTSFNETDVTITVTSTTAFTYANTGGDVTSGSDTGGIVTNDSFLDDFVPSSLIAALTTYDYDQPDADMIGITTGPNGLLFGFFGNQLCFAEPAHPHAWPIKYRITFEYDIVAVASVGGYIVVLTDTYAYRVSGNEPATMAAARIDTPYPCLSKQSVVNMGYGVLYATHGGLAMWSPSTGITLVTKALQDWDTWEDELDPSTIKAFFYNDKYFATHSTGSFIFEHDAKVGGYYINTSDIFTAAWSDPVTNDFFFIAGANGGISQWDKDDQPLGVMEWKSKTIITKDYINLGAARVVADYSLSAAEAAIINAANAAATAANVVTWTESEQLGSLNGPTDYLVSAVPVYNYAGLNTCILHGDCLMQKQQSFGAELPITFELWANKALVYSTVVASSDIFRLPSGYKSDTYEVSVSGSARVRSIHIGETPYGLREV